MYKVACCLFYCGFMFWQHLRYYQASGWLSTCYRQYALYSTAPPGDQIAGVMIQIPTQSHNSDIDTEPTSGYTLLLMPSARLGSEKYKFGKPLLWLGCDSNSRPSAQESCTLSDSVIIAWLSTQKDIVRYGWHDLIHRHHHSLEIKLNEIILHLFRTHCFLNPQSH